jgi:hypothetical protein
MALPLWLIVVLLVIVMLQGRAPEPTVIVNDHPGCAGPARTLTASQLASSEWWHDC